jgi:hypothetical protein
MLACFVARPLTLARQSLKLRGFKRLRISFITSGSPRPNCCSIASKGVLSSQAISMILDSSSSEKSNF